MLLGVGNPLCKQVLKKKKKKKKVLFRNNKSLEKGSIRLLNESTENNKETRGQQLT